MRGCRIPCEHNEHAVVEMRFGLNALEKRLQPFNALRPFESLHFSPQLGPVGTQFNPLAVMVMQNVVWVALDELDVLGERSAEVAVQGVKNGRKQEE